jgi:hypothetical protein
MAYQHNNRLQGYANAVVHATLKQSESVYQKIADSFEDDLLEFDDFPADYFNFVLALLTEGQFYSRRGLWNFLLVLSTEKQKLTPQHYDRLATAIMENYSNYLDEDLCLAVCDFIARNYPADYAKQVLDKLRSIESSKAENLKGIADEGLWILGREISRGVGHEN